MVQRYNNKIKITTTNGCIYCIEAILVEYGSDIQNSID